MKVRKIALEEAFTFDAFREETAAIRSRFNPAWARYVGERIEDLGDRRIADMDAAGIDVQVLSLTSPGIQGMEDPRAAVATAARANDLLAGAVRAHPTRFAGFAALPCQDPRAAVAELERAVKQLGFKGALVNGHTRGAYLDEQRFWCIWEAAEALDVPIYVHPTDPVSPWACCQGYPIGGVPWGWAFETGSHALRVILAGVFDRFPKATMILGHMGEFLPFSLVRLDDRMDFVVARTGLEHAPSHYVRRNVLVTTSGVHDPAALRCTLDVLGSERVLFAVDYPYQRNEDAARFIESVDLSERDRALVCHGNAERVLRLRAD